MSNKFSNELRRISKQLKNVDDIIERVLENVARRIEVDLIVTFHSQSDPQGKKWSQRKGSYSHPINYNTGKLDSSREVEVFKDNIRVSYNADHAKWVNNVRQLVPSKVPTKWTNYFEEELQKELNKL